MTESLKTPTRMIDEEATKKETIDKSNKSSIKIANKSQVNFKDMPKQ